MKTSEALDKIAPALVAALAGIDNATKDRTNPHFKSTYATLASVIEATKAGLAAQGLVVIQTPGWAEGRATVTTRVIHNSGQWIEATAEAPVTKADAQGVGSAITYLRRYSLAAVCGITQEDDDGQAASRPRAEPRPTTPPVREPSDAEWAELADQLVQVAERGLASEAEIGNADAVIRGRAAARFSGLKAWLTKLLTT